MAEERLNALAMLSIEKNLIRDSLDFNRMSLSPLQLTWNIFLLQLYFTYPYSANVWVLLIAKCGCCLFVFLYDMALGVVMVFVPWGTVLVVYVM